MKEKLYCTKTNNTFKMQVGFENSIPLYKSTIKRIDKRTKKYGNQRLELIKNKK